MNNFDLIYSYVISKTLDHVSDYRRGRYFCALTKAARAAVQYYKISKENVCFYNVYKVELKCSIVLHQMKCCIHSLFYNK